MTISKELLDELLNGVKNADDLLGDQGLMKEPYAAQMDVTSGAKPNGSKPT